MKKKASIFTTFILLLFMFPACIFMGPSIQGNGNVAEENRKTGEFDEIEVSRGMNVYISQGEFTKVIVRADENLMDAIETVTQDNKLIVRAKQNIRNAKSKKVFVTVPKISEITSSSGSNVYSETKLSAKNLEISTSSGSNMTLEINVGNLESSASSGSNIKLQLNAENAEAEASAGSNIFIEGKTDAFSGKVSSGANIKAENLTCENCTAQASSGGNIWITANKELNGKVSSGGNVFYYGDAETKNIEKSSGGNVIKK